MVADRPRLALEELNGGSASTLVPNSPGRSEGLRECDGSLVDGWREAQAQVHLVGQCGPFVWGLLSDFLLPEAHSFTSRKPFPVPVEPGVGQD